MNWKLERGEWLFLFHPCWFLCWEIIANWNTEGNGLVQRGITGVMTTGEICRSESSCMHDGEISCLGGNGGGGWQYGLFTHSSRREGEYMGLGADEWIEVMVRNNLVGLFLFSFKKWVVQYLRCMSLEELVPGI